MYELPRKTYGFEFSKIGRKLLVIDKLIKQKICQADLNMYV